MAYNQLEEKTNYVRFWTGNGFKVFDDNDHQKVWLHAKLNENTNVTVGIDLFIKLNEKYQYAKSLK